MGYNNRRSWKNVRNNFWRGYNRGQKQRGDFGRGVSYGKRLVFRSILRCVEIAIVVTAIFVILHGVDSVDTVPVIAARR